MSKPGSVESRLWTATGVVETMARKMNDIVKAEREVVACIFGTTTDVEAGGRPKLKVVEDCHIG